jgi:hypothetical protein
MGNRCLLFIGRTWDDNNKQKKIVLNNNAVRRSWVYINRDAIMKENEKETAEKIDETFLILFEELTSSLIMSVKDFFDRFEHTLKTRTQIQDVLGIIFSSHLSSLKFWSEKISDSANNEGLKNKLDKIISDIENVISSQSGATIHKNGEKNGKQ